MAIDFPDSSTVMDLEEFSDSLFETVQLWTLTKGAAEYALFLRNLYLRVTHRVTHHHRNFRSLNAVTSTEDPDDALEAEVHDDASEAYASEASPRKFQRANIKALHRLAMEADDGWRMTAEEESSAAEEESRRLTSESAASVPFGERAPPGVALPDLRAYFCESWPEAIQAWCVRC